MLIRDFSFQTALKQSISIFIFFCMFFHGQIPPYVIEFLSEKDMNKSPERIAN